MSIFGAELLSVLVERHAEAFLALLRADSELSGTVFEGDVPGDPERYVNVYHDTGFYTAHDALGIPVDLAVTFTVHSVGLNRWQAVWTSDRARSRVLAQAPQIEGRRCWRIESAGSQPVTRDDDASPVKWFAADRYVLRSTPRR